MPDTPNTARAAASERLPPVSAVPAWADTAAERTRSSPGRTSCEVQPDELVGTTLSGTYTILRVLGEGGMGRVYEAQHTRIASKRFAVKTLHPELARRPELIERFQREAEAAAAISSAHVVGVYDVDVTEGGQPYLVGELLQGEELGDYIGRTGPLSLELAAHLARQICRGLMAAHERGVVHRDLKPENVFLVGEGPWPTAKVIDFGISRLDGLGGSKLTETGMIMGTPAYMAPEQASGHRVDHRADVYGVGAILYTALTGRPPFEASSAQAAIVAVLTRDPDPLRSVAPHVPEPLELVVQRAMAKERDDRYPSMEDLHAALAPYDTSPLDERRSALVAGGGQGIGDAAPTRSALAACLALGAAGALWGLWTMLGGVLRFVLGSDVTRTHIALTLLALCCTLATPAALIVRHLQREVWRNTAKVQELLGVVRDPILAGAATYGVGALWVRLTETMLVAAPAGLAWPGWDLLLPLLGFGAAGGTAWLARQRGRGVAALPSHVAAAVAGAVVIGTTVAAIGLRGDGLPVERDDGAMVTSTAGAQPVPRSTASAASSVERILTELGAEPSGAPVLVPVAVDRQRALALTVELEKAIKLGRAREALDKLEELIALDPRALDDAKLFQTVKGLTVHVLMTDTPERTRLLELLTGRLGSSGVDILYALMTTSGGTMAARYAQALLAEEPLRARGTAALRIAYDLRTAPTCEAKVALFDRVTRDGDERALTELRILNNCERPQCCLRNDERVKAAIAAIFDRRRQAAPSPP